MLYPKKCINKEKRNILERLKYIKESILGLLIIFNSCDSIVLFLEQKFHF